MENWCSDWITNYKSIFGIVVTGAVQSIFYLEIHQNNIFYFKKNIFDISTSKRYKNIKKSKKSKFKKTASYSQIHPNYSRC
jgi:hypothetical protein